MQLLMAYFEDFSKFGLYHVSVAICDHQKKIMATSGKKKHTLNCNFTWQSQISIDLGRLSIFIFRLKNWVILGELPQSNQPFLVDCRIAGGAHWANPDISETVYSFMVEFSWQKNDVQDGPPASFKKKNFKSKFV